MFSNTVRGLFIIIFALVSSTCIGKGRVLKKPQAYFIPDGNWCDKSSPRAELPYSLGAWVVFADRSGIPFLESPKKKKSGSFSKALEPYYVIGEEDSFLLLHTCNDSIQLDKSGNLKGGSELGWARKDNLILWETALYSKPFGLQRMAFPVLNRYENVLPGISVDFKAHQEIQDSAAFFYIVKESPTQYLLSSRGSFKFPYHASLMGWFPKNLFFEWSSNKGFILTRQDTAVARLKVSQKTIKPSKGSKPTPKKAVIFFPVSNQDCLLTRIAIDDVTLAYDSEFVRIKNKRAYFQDEAHQLSKCGMAIPITERLLSGRQAHAISVAIVEEMKEYYQENLVNINLQDSKLLQARVKNLFGIVCLEFKVTTDDFKLEEFQNFFGKSIYLPLSMRDRRINQLAAGAIPESDIRFFLDGIGKLLSSGDNVYDLDFLNAKGNTTFKLFF